MKRKQPQPRPRRLATTETLSYVGGLYAELSEQLQRYHELTAQLFSLQARLEVVEKNLCVTRDHVALAIDRSEERIAPDWADTLQRVRFVGTRLADACVSAIREHKRITHVELLNELNIGMFRFRTNAPAREIHAALLRQQYVKRTSDGWAWTGPDETSPEAPSKASSLRLIQPDDSPVAGAGLGKGGVPG